METVSSTLGSPTNTGWKRRARARPSRCACGTRPAWSRRCSAARRGPAGFSRLEASIAPSALPAPISVCSSSMKSDHPPAAVFDLLEHALEALLELAAVLGPGDHRAEVERQHALVLQRLRHVAVDDAQRQPLDDGGLADAGLADQHGVVLGAARQHLDGAADLLVAADHRVELAAPARPPSGRAHTFFSASKLLLGAGRYRPCGPCERRSMACFQLLAVVMRRPPAPCWAGVSLAWRAPLACGPAPRSCRRSWTPAAGRRPARARARG
jgi:hypothetical protein